MKPISILSAAVFTAATVYVTWPAAASALPPNCRLLESRLSDAQKLAPILRRNVGWAQGQLDNVMADKRRFDKVLDCRAHGSNSEECRWAELEAPYPVMHEGTIFDRDTGTSDYYVEKNYDEKKKQLDESAKWHQSTLNAEKERLNGTLQEIDYLPGALDKCIAKEAARKKARAREAERKAPRHKASKSREPRKRQTARSRGDNNGRPAGKNIPDTAATAAAIGFVSGILNASGVLNGRRGGGGGGGGVIGGVSCHPYRDGRPGMDCSGH